MKQNIYDHPVFFEKYKDLRDNDRELNELIEHRPQQYCRSDLTLSNIWTDLQF